MRARDRWLTATFLATLGGAVTLLLGAAACGREWDQYDPRVTTTVVSSSSSSSSSSGGMGGGGGGPTGGAGGEGGAGGQPPVSCSGWDLVNEPFSADIAGDWFTFAGVGAAVDVAGGQLQFSYDGSPQLYAEINGKWAHDLTGHSIGLQFLSFPTAATDDDYHMFFKLYSDDEELVVRVTQSNIIIEKQIDGMTTMLHQTEFDSQNTPFIRFREEAGTVYWEVSPNGDIYDAIYSAAVSDLFDVRYLRARIGSFGMAEAGGTLVLDNLVGGGTASNGQCPLGDLTDDFEDGLVGRQWVPSGASDCSVSETDVLEIFLAASGPTGGCGVSTARYYSMNEQGVSVEVTSPPTHPEVQFLFAAHNDYQYGAMFRIHQGQLEAIRIEDGMWVTPHSAPHVPDEHRWLRLQHTPPSMVWEVSTDGVQWGRFHTGPSAFTGSDVTVTLTGTRTLDPLPQNQTMAFDNLNIMP